MTRTQKKEALKNTLTHYNLSDKYFIESADSRLGSRFAIAENFKDSTGINVKTNYMTYEEFNAFMFGFNAGVKKQLEQKQ